MRVLGIDPGYDRMGAAIVEKQDGREKVIYSSCLTSSAKDDFADRLLCLGQQLEQLIERWQPTVLATEKLFLTNNQKTATNISEVRGMIVYLARKYGLAIAQYTPMEIKQTVTGYGNADKKQMIGLIEKLVVLPAGRRLDDEYDAIGAALTHLACAKFHAIS
jgi:crossover junction endodeoxyribonuclease RuvC